jgi:signal transduction histidine kinase
MRERATLAGATLDVESTNGRGTAVYVRAPVQDTSKEAARD